MMDAIHFHATLAPVRYMNKFCVPVPFGIHTKAMSLLKRVEKNTGHVVVILENTDQLHFVKDANNTIEVALPAIMNGYMRSVHLNMDTMNAMTKIIHFTRDVL